MNRVRVITDRDLTAEEVNRIRDIMLHSRSKHEDLVCEITYCKGYINGEIHIYRGDTETKSIIVEY